MRFYEVVKKVFRIIKTEGIRAFIRKSLLYISARRQAGHPEKVFMDVLFINGCHLPHPSRYRVSHQREQLLANGIVNNEVFYENLTLDMVKYYRLFVFFRCPANETVESFIALARENQKTVLFDIDDLVIDNKYTDLIKYVMNMPPQEKQFYDDGVNRMQRLLSLCDGAVTTTTRLAEELKNYTLEVYINRNTASENMVKASLKALDTINHKRSTKDNFTKIGYFSGSITHNDDIKMILPALVRVLAEYENVQLHFVGELDMPEELKAYRSRIVARSFMDWRKLPACIASVDINIAPMEDTIFNEAKSENKWVEASLVKVPTIGSSVGAMREMIENNVTGILVRNSEEEWHQALSALIKDESKRRQIGEAAQKFVMSHCTTMYTGFQYAQYIRSKFQKNIAFILPSVQTSGGVLVALKHCIIMKKAGYDVLILSEDYGSDNVTKEGNPINVISLKEARVRGSFDKAVATLWSTVDFLNSYPNIRERMYLVQNFETDFYEYGNPLRLKANQTYCINSPEIKYLTISRWCQNWLEENFQKESAYTPNGIDTNMFRPRKRQLGDRIRILIEGNSEDYYKNVDESFRIVQKLRRQKYEIWYMSYKGEPKNWYIVDKFFHKVPYERVPEIYSQCDILLKSSLLESFSYPPLEMMATGGYAVVAANPGNQEYLISGENCMLYNAGEIDEAVQGIEAIVHDAHLRETLYKKGLETVQSRDWDSIKEEIVRLYIQ